MALAVATRGFTFTMRTLLCCAALLLGGCEEPNSVGLSGAQRERLGTLGPLGDPLPSPGNAYADDPDAQAFGRALFHDGRLSAGATLISCDKCHHETLAWGDDRERSTNYLGESSRWHSSSLTAIGHQEWFFWDGRADSLWAQCVPVLGGVHGLSGERLVEVLNEEDFYRQKYEQLFGDIPDFAEGESSEEVDWSPVVVNVCKAIEAFERTIISTDSPLDRYLAGEESSLSAAQLRGAKLFVADDGCIACHSGPALSDGWFHNVGHGADEEGALEGIPKALAGDYSVASSYSDAADGDALLRTREERFEEEQGSLRGAFKTPGLRDVALRPRFGHLGEYGELREWLDFHSRGEADTGNLGEVDPLLVGRRLSEDELSDLEAFLGALTGNPS